MKLERQLRCDSWGLPQMFSTNKQNAEVPTRERGGSGPPLLIALISTITSSAGLSRLRAGEPGNRDSISGPQQKIFVFSKTPDLLCRPCSPLFSRYCGLFPPGYRVPGRETDHYHLAQFVEALRYKPEGRRFDT